MLALPSKGVLAATQELIGFLALLMAGLLPAMILTATILRGDGFSAKRVDDYGKALVVQLRFWGFLFAFAGMATAAIVLAKVISASEVKFALQWRKLRVDDAFVIRATIACAGFFVGCVLQRLYPAFKGVASLLELNVAMAKAQALAADRSRSDALMAEVKQASQPAEYGPPPEDPKPPRRRSRPSATR